MIYIFDTNSFIVLGHYFPRQFPSFWQSFNSAVIEGRILSVREVYNELNNNASNTALLDWVVKNKQIFLPPSVEETKFVARIFLVPHFKQLIGQKQILKGTPVADPFIIASAKTRHAIVVTEESEKKNAAKIPNVCKHFSIEFTDLQGFMERERWQF